MSEEILVNVTPQETRVAVLENGMLQEIYIDRIRSRGITGNIYLGKVVRVLPGIQAAFVDINLERTAFLHARDLVKHLDLNNNTENSNHEVPLITTMLQDGQQLLVQVNKDPIGGKGARLSGQISIPSHNLVFLPNADFVGVSQRISDQDKREEIRTTIEGLKQELKLCCGFIARTAAENADIDQLCTDMEYLNRSWNQINRIIDQSSAPALIHEDLPLVMRTMRDLVWENVEKVRIDSRETYENVLKFTDELIPRAAGKVSHYPGERPIFDLYTVEDEIEKALQTHAPLKSGGYMVIDQTEAMTTIDVNTGSFVGKRKLEETVFKTNLEAAHALARQLRVRNIGGIIIVDFIDMNEQNHKEHVMRALESALSQDSADAQVNDMTSLGLVEIIRKRTSESLEQLVSEPCPACAGRGIQKTPETCCYEIFREILREARQFDTEKYLVVASQEIIDRLLEEESSGLEDLQGFIGKTVHLQVEPTYHQEQYDVVLM